MVSVFIKEGKKYNKDELCQMFDLDDYDWRLFSGRLAAKRILKSVSKDDKESEDDFDSEDEFYDDGTGVLYVFKYVGIIVYKKWIIKCYPKYIRNVDDNILTYKLGQVLQVIRKDKSTKTTFSLLGESDQSSNNRLSLMMYLLDDYFANGVYSNDTDIIEINGSGEIDWNRTVNYVDPFISDGCPYYLELHTKRRIVNDYDYFRRLHECILTKCSKEIEQYGLVDLLNVTTVDLSGDDIEDFGDADYILYRLNSEKNVQFNTRKLLLLEYMELFIKEYYATKGSDVFELYGTGSFNLVWEDVCAFVLDSQLKRPILELEIPEGINEKYKRYKNMLEIIEKPKWGIHRAEAKKTLTPDLISFRRTETTFDFIIFDAKYYNIRIEEDKVAGQPGVEDLVKQYSYQMAYLDFISDHKISGVRNCFLMPTDLDYVVTDKGAATLDMYSRMGLEDIRIRLLPATVMYKYYLSGKKYDLGNLNL